MQALHGQQLAAGELAIKTLLLVLVRLPLFARHLAPEQDWEDLAVPAAVETSTVVWRQRRQPVAFGEERERFGVQMHVVDDGAVDVEDDGPRRKTQRHTRLCRISYRCPRAASVDRTSSPSSTSAGCRWPTVFSPPISSRASTTST